MTLTVKRKPTHTFPGIWEDRLFSNFFDQPNQVERNPTQTALSNVIENDIEYKIELSVPGYQKQDITIDLEDGLLSIKGKKELQAQEKGLNYTRKEFNSSEFHRSFRLPKETINQDAIVAKLELGILAITLPKKKEVVEAMAPKSIDIG